MSSIVIADPQPFVLAALRQRLSAAGHEIIGEAMDGRHALELVQRLHQGLLLELDLPRLSGLELLQRLHHELPKQKSLVFTQLAGARYQGLVLRELQIGSPTQAQAAALIQLKLPRGSPRF